MNKEERATYQRDYRKRSKQPRKQGDSLQENVNKPVNVNSDSVIMRHLVEEVMGLTERAQLLEETVANLTKAQVKVSVVPGSVIRPRDPGVSLGGLSKAAQASGKRMVDNSPMGRMFRGEG
jgi:hypothetical protein